jgi:hypothetical protein
MILTIVECIAKFLESIPAPEPTPMDPLTEIGRRTALQVQLPMAQRFYFEQVLEDQLRERRRLESDLTTAHRLGRQDLYGCHLATARELDRDIAHQRARLEQALWQQAEAERWRDQVYLETRQLEREMDLARDAEVAARVNELRAESQMILSAARARAGTQRRDYQLAGAEARAIVESCRSDARYQLERAVIDADWQGGAR